MEQTMDSKAAGSILVQPLLQFLTPGFNLHSLAWIVNCNLK